MSDMKSTSYFILGALLMAIFVALSNANHPDTNLHTNAVASRVILTSSTGNDTYIECADASRAGVLCPSVLERISILWAEYESAQDGTEAGHEQQNEEQ